MKVSYSISGMEERQMVVSAEHLQRWRPVIILVENSMMTDVELEFGDEELATVVGFAEAEGNSDGCGCDG